MNPCNVLWLLGVAAVAACSKAPRLEIPFPSHDFGTLYPGDGAEHDFEFANAGDADLLIQAITASCGCTAADVWVETPEGIPRRGDLEKTGEVLWVHPGERGKVRVLLSTKTLGQGGEARAGSILLRTNELGRPHAALQFLVRVERPYQLEKERFDLGRVGRRESTRFSARIVPSAGRSFRIAKVVPSHRALHGEVSAEERNGSPALRVEIVAGPDLPEGPFNGRVDLHTDLPNGHVISIPVYGIVLGDIVIEPPYLFFPLLSRGNAGSSAVEIRCTDPNQKLRIGKVSVEGTEAASFSTRLDEIESGRLYRLHLESSPELSTAAFRGNVVVETGYPEKPTLEIPYRGFVR